LNFAHNTNEIQQSIFDSIIDLVLESASKVLVKDFLDKWIANIIKVLQQLLNQVLCKQID
jgi:flagellar biosynthesis/type III secretory pathway protein FliH